MSKYTTGEIAKLCGVSVRTVQYYDTRNLLVPSELSEGGRRLYNDNDLKKMRIICFLREAGFPINSISTLFQEENPESVISVLLEQQEQMLKEEIGEREKQLLIVENIKNEIKDMESFSVESIGDIAHLMKNKIKLQKLRAIMIATGVPATLFFWTSVLLWITIDLWWLCILATVLLIGVSFVISFYYFNSVAYICPNCHEVFKPKLKEFILAYHTPKMRRLTCPKCKCKSLCVEVFADDDSSNDS